MRPEDYDQLIELWQQAGLEHRPSGRDGSEKMLVELNNLQEEFILAFAEDKLVGSIVVTHDGRKGWLNRLAVAPKFRGKGIARNLVKKAEDFLLSQNIEIFACLIEEWNENSLQIFTHLGYVRHDDIKYFTKRLHPEI